MHSFSSHVDEHAQESNDHHSHQQDHQNGGQVGQAVKHRRVFQFLLLLGRPYKAENVSLYLVFYLGEFADYLVRKGFCLRDQVRLIQEGLYLLGEDLAGILEMDSLLAHHLIECLLFVVQVVGILLLSTHSLL